MYVTRQQWGARPPSRPTGQITGPVSTVFVHHNGDLTAGCDTLDAGAKKMRADQAYHMDTNGWADIGYSFGFDQVGNCYEARGWGVVGAHTSGYNDIAYAFVALLDSRTENASDACLDAMAAKFVEGQHAGVLTANAGVLGHRDVLATDCPGDPLYALLPALRARIAHPSTTPPAATTNDEDMMLASYTLPGNPTVYLRHPGSGVVRTLNECMSADARAAKVDPMSVLADLVELGFARPLYKRPLGWDANWALAVMDGRVPPVK